MGDDSQDLSEGTGPLARAPKDPQFRGSLGWSAVSPCLVSILPRVLMLLGWRPCPCRPSGQVSPWRSTAVEEGDRCGLWPRGAHGRTRVSSWRTGSAAAPGAGPAAVRTACLGVWGTSHPWGFPCATTWPGICVAPGRDRGTVSVLPQWPVHLSSAPGSCLAPRPSPLLIGWWLKTPHLNTTHGFPSQPPRAIRGNGWTPLLCPQRP